MKYFFCLAAIALLVAFLNVSCTNKLDNITEPIDTNVLGNFHNQALDYYFHHYNKDEKGDIFTEYGLPVDNYELFKYSTREFILTLGYDSTFVDSVIIQCETMLTDIGAFKEVDGQEYIVPFDSPFLASSYNFVRDNGFLTESEKELLDPVSALIVTGASVEELDTAVMYLNSRLGLYNPDEIQKALDFSAVYTSSSEYWTDLYASLPGGGIYYADAAGSVIGGIAGTIIGFHFGGPVGADAGSFVGGLWVSTFYSWMTKKTNQWFCHS